jgi:hypothetical protein
MFLVTLQIRFFASLNSNLTRQHTSQHRGDMPKYVVPQWDIEYEVVYRSTLHIDSVGWFLSSNAALPADAESTARGASNRSQDCAGCGAHSS